MNVIRISNFHINTDLKLFLVLALTSILISIATAAYGIMAGVSILAGLLSVVAVGLILSHFQFGLYILIIYAHFMFLISSLIPVPVGTLVDSIILLSLLALLIKNKFTTSNLLPATSDKSYFKDWVGLIMILIFCYDLIQLFNPKSHISFSQTILQIREPFYLLSVSYLAYTVINDKKGLKFFTGFIIAMCLLVAFYGIFQEFAGLRESEWRMLRSDPRKFELYVIWGRVRKWSFLSDPSVYGMQMAFCGILTFILCLGKMRVWKKLAFLAISITCLLAMSYSGTRTAVGMVPLGIAMYFFMTINNVKTVIASIFVTILFMVIIFGPFYGGTANRIRSTFNKSDPSLSFRDMKRRVLQNYVFSNPLGSGLGTANGIAKRLTITADTDNGYLRTLVDKGFPGLFLQLLLYALVMIFGINYYYATEDPELKNIVGAYLAGIFALTFANFYQDVADQKPLNLIMVAAFGLLTKIRSVENKSAF
jgi:putative inorganic carbon (hco3(-)) transporter